MGFFSRGGGEPARADVVPGSIQVDQGTTEAVHGADGKVTASLGVVVQGWTGMQRVNRSYPLWMVQVFRDLASDRPLGKQLPRALDVPVRIDPTTGKVKQLDLDALADELAPHRELATETWRRQHGLLSPVTAVTEAPRKLLGGLRGIKDQLTAHLDDIRSAPPAPTVPRPTPETHPPIEGVDYDTWVRATIRQVRAGVGADGQAAFLEAQGFPAGRADAITDGWWARAHTDDAVRDWFGHDSRTLDPDA